MAAGHVCAQLVGTVCVSLFGEAWLFKEPPQVPEREGESLGKAIGEYFVARGVPSLPPEVALLAAAFAYASPRFSDPRTRERAAALARKVGIVRTVPVAAPKAEGGAT